jgi:hypothetical protein
MLTFQEYRLIAIVVSVLALGAVVKSCRNHVTVSEIEKSKESVVEPGRPADDGQE